MLNVKLAKPKMENEEGMNHLMVTVTPEVLKEKLEKPIAFVLLFDVSGSMGSVVGGGSRQNKRSFLSSSPFNEIKQNSFQEFSTKLDYVKQASERLVDMMKDGDMLGVVSFSDIASLEFPLKTLNDDVRFQLKEQIRGLKTRGMTNISDGMELAYQQIPNELRETHHIKILLLSDGNANYGITNPDGIGTLASSYRANDVSISTIGVGEDYNSYFMETIATTSGGMFYHLKRMDELNELFTQELETLTSITMKQAKISIFLEEGLKKELNLNGFQEENGYVYVGNVFNKQFILTEVYTEAETYIGTRTIKVVLDYIDSVGKGKQVTESIKVDLVEESSMHDVVMDKQVVEYVKEMMEAKIKKDALRQYEIGNINEATRSIDVSKLKMDSFQASYSINMDEAFGKISDLSESMMSRSLSSEASKTMYSDSFQKTRNNGVNEKK